MTLAPGRDGDDQLMEQWSFLDSMIERQASSLRAGVQDPEETEAALMAPMVAPPERDDLHTMIAALESERDALRRELEGTKNDLARAQSDRADAMSAAEKLAALRQELDQTRAGAKAMQAALATAEDRLPDIALLQAALETERSARITAESARGERDALRRELDVTNADLQRAQHHQALAISTAKELAVVRSELDQTRTAAQATQAALDDAKSRLPEIALLRTALEKERAARTKAESAKSELMRALSGAHFDTQTSTTSAQQGSAPQAPTAASPMSRDERTFAPPDHVDATPHRDVSAITDPGFYEDAEFQVDARPSLIDRLFGRRR